MNFQAMHPSAISLRAPDGTSAVAVPALGGIVSSLCFATATGPREVLFRHEHFWDTATHATRGGIPLLFPVCGRLERGEYERAGRVYSLPIHGFAMRRPWRVENQTTSRVELSLDATAEESYPFSARLTMVIEVRDQSLLMALEIENAGAAAMPFSAGWHPYFLTPDAGPEKGGVSVRLPAREVGRYNESYTGITSWEEPLPNPLVPTHPLFKEVLHRVDSGSVEIRWPDGFALQLTAKLDGGAPFPFWQMHTEHGKPFVCVEPWSSPPNALNSGESLLHLAPGARWTMSIDFEWR